LRVQFEKRKPANNLNRMNQAISKKFGIPPPNFSSFTDAFEYLSKQDIDIIVLDEFSYLIRYSDALAEFQTIIDETLADSNILLIVLGSSYSIMKRGLLEYSSPIYGRSDLLINLQPLGLLDIMRWYPGLSLEDVVRVHGCCGGVPRYLEIISGQDDIKKEIEVVLLDPNSFLFREGRELLEEEFDDPATYFSILEAVSMGSTRVTEIGNHAFLEPKNTAKYLKILTEMGILKREFSYLMNKKRGIYRFRDPYFSIWFRFVSRYFEDIEAGFDKEARSRFVRDFNMYMGYHLESAMVELVPMVVPFEVTSGGRWWKGDAEIDHVIEGRSDICFIEFKWGQPDTKAVKDIFTELEEISRMFRNRRKRVHHLLIARDVKGKMKVEGKSQRVVTLSEIEMIVRKGSN